MIKQPIQLTPLEVRVLARCPLHYHFLQQKSNPRPETDHFRLDQRVRRVIQQLHAAGGPSRLSLADCVNRIDRHPRGRLMIEHYYHRLEHDWAQVMAANESIELKISLGGVSIILQGIVDRLDRTSDDGILAILFRTESDPLPSSAKLRRDHAMTIYHALVAATYPLKRPVRLQELWLHHNQDVTIELSEDEYRHNLSDLREPVQALARSEVMARPGLHCDVCPFQHHGCPVYSHETADQETPPDFAATDSDGKISPRKWIFKI
jgi:RecB family exonuclease